MSDEVELGLTGKGVAPAKIEELDKLIEEYIDWRDRRTKLTTRENEAKENLIEAMHNHAEELANRDGDLIYRYNETVVSLVAGPEKFKIETKEIP